MNCREARETMVDCLDATPSDELRAHLAGCARCRNEWESNQAAWQELRPVKRIVASHQLRERTMTAIAIEAERERAGRPLWTWKGWPKWALAACTALLLVILAPMVPVGTRNTNRSGIALLAQSLDSMAQLRTVHIIGRMRTIPGDDFDTISTQHDFVPIEMWHQYGSPDRWRVDKPERIVVMDGEQMLLYLPKNNMAGKGERAAGFVEWLRPLLNPETVLASELEAVRQGKAEAKLAEAHGELTLTITRTAQGDFTHDWLRNKAIDYSDHTRVYRFDPVTKRLEGLKVIVHAGGEDVPVLELTSFAYNESLGPQLFTLQLPPDVNWMLDEASMPPTAANLPGAREAAAFFLDALARQDWKSVQEILPLAEVPAGIRQLYGGSQVVSLGEPFRSGKYPGWFVPYEVRLTNGETRHLNLALRNDNPQRRWMIDGGY